jgi:hypothetical protein
MPSLRTVAFVPPVPRGPWHCCAHSEGNLPRTEHGALTVRPTWVIAGKLGDGGRPWTGAGVSRGCSVWDPLPGSEAPEPFMVPWGDRSPSAA